MSQTDVKHILRKLDFPACAKEALARIESIVSSRSKQNLAIQLISEFIFMVDIRKGPQFATSQLNSFQEFQLILVLIEYFSQPGPDATRNVVFLSLFGSNLTPQRSKILCRLVSTAVSASVAPLLSSAGTWMQQMGCTNPPSLEVAQSLVNDFITFSRKTSEKFKQLPMVAPHFAANLMTAVADLYVNEQRGELTPPPDSLLDVFTEWISEDPALCLASQQPLALPSGAIAMPVVTPLAGLIRWAVLAPLFSNRPTYSNLHLWLLQTMLQIVNSGPPTALSAQHLSQIVSAMQAYVVRLLADKTDPTKDEGYQKSMERLAQAVQVATSSNCMYGNIPQLLSLLEALPPNPLMTLVIKANKSV
ncbi:integrator complex subunit 15 [Eurosta solidaginis]|uniref:integrator complex subunit 15 n=1 Tax=Eurosta solidaginis TaxID=178769 RepID=UPI0035305EE2